MSAVNRPLTPIDALSRAVMNVEPKPDPFLWYDRSKGVVPRIGYYETSPVPILAVGKCPGHPRQEGVQKIWQAQIDGRDPFDAYRAWQRDAQFSSSNRAFHSGTRLYLRELLQVPESEVWQHAAYTHLVKVSTREKLQPLLPQWVDEWWPWFEKEIKAFRPVMLVALGTEVADHLRARMTRNSKRTLPLLALPEPSYRARWPQALARIREVQPLVNDLLDGWREHVREVA